MYLRPQKIRGVLPTRPLTDIAADDIERRVEEEKQKTNG